MANHLTTRLVMLGAVVAASISVGLPAASADDAKLPFTDPQAQGTLGFCDRQGHNIVSGKVNSVPFVWRVVSSTPAPKGYADAMAKATLYAFQPRDKVPPGEWSGKQMTGSSSFKSPAHPGAQSTTLDPSLIEFTGIAPLWNGLVQLRLYYTNVNAVVHQKPYPATVIQVTGDTWHIVSGGNVSCVNGAAVSIESQLLDASKFPSAAPPQTNPAGNVPAPLQPDAAVTPLAGELAGTGGSQAAANATAGVNGANPLLLGGILAAAFAAGAIVYLTRRQQAQPAGRREAGRPDPTPGGRRGSSGSHARN